MSAKHNSREIAGAIGELLTTKRDACSACFRQSTVKNSKYFTKFGRTTEDERISLGGNPEAVQDTHEAVEEQPEAPQIEQESEPEIDLLADPSPRYNP